MLEPPVPTVEDGVLRVETLVPGSPEAVLGYVAELRNMERWWPEHRRYRRLSGDGGPGTRYYWIYAAKGGVLLGLTCIEERAPGLLAYRTALAGLPVRMRYQLLPEGASTRVRAEMRCVGLRLRLFARGVSAEVVAALARLSRVAEEGAF